MVTIYSIYGEPDYLWLIISLTPDVQLAIDFSSTSNQYYYWNTMIKSIIFRTLDKDTQLNMIFALELAYNQIFLKRNKNKVWWP